jgi:hypothetical protein
VTLADYLARATRTPFAWGGLNCLTFPADWALARRGVDLADGFRGRVKTELGAHRFLKRQGGLLAFASARAQACGLEPTDCAVSGDVGVVEAVGANGARVAAGAICTGRRWALMAAGVGVIVSDMTPLAAWRV